MEIVVLTIMLMAGVNFVLKLTWHKLPGLLVTTVIAALFVGLTWDIAVEQSKTRIADWLNRPDLMLDTAVLLTIDVFFQIAFCVMMAKRVSGSALSRTERTILTITKWFPGLLIFPVLFSALVEVIFAFPGTDFALLAWSLALAVAVAAPALALGLRMLVPERDMRLELMFLINMLIAVLGVIATVNGRTAAAGTNSVDCGALAGVFAILAIGAIAGFFINKRITKHNINKLK